MTEIDLGKCHHKTNPSSYRTALNLYSKLSIELETEEEHIIECFCSYFITNNTRKWYFFPFMP